jgi:hypothetical protein
MYTSILVRGGRFVLNFMSRRTSVRLPGLFVVNSMIGCSSKMLPSLETLDTNVGITDALDALRPNVIRSMLMAELILGS